MIPTLILLGLVFGRWWRSTLTAAALGWPAFLVASDVMHVEPGLLGAAALAIANTGVGVLIHQGILWMVRKVSRSGPAGSGV